MYPKSDRSQSGRDPRIKELLTEPLKEETPPCRNLCFTEVRGQIPGRRRKLLLVSGIR